jgi:predicted permease
MGTVAQDLKYAVRGMLRSRMFTLAALAAAALGIGSTTAVFSVVDRILFRPLPYRDGGRLVSAGLLTPLDFNEFLFAQLYFTMRDAGAFEQTTSFVAGVNDCDVTEANPIRLGCLAVEGNFLDVLGVAPAAGRNFTPDEDRPGAPQAALISNSLWHTRYGGDPAISGRTLELDGRRVRIAGVLPADFETPTLARADILLPEQLNPATERAGRALRVFARLKAGSTAAQAEAALGPWFQASLAVVPPNFRKEVRLKVRSLRDRQVDEVRQGSWILIGAVITVLLIACANIANLLLARAAGREREWTIRLALGASRWRIARQMLTESVVLGIAGGALGCAVAWALLRWFVGMAPAGVPRIAEATLDPRVLVFALAASALTGLLFGIAPALRNPAVLRVRSASVREWLVAAQLAASVVLLAGAGLLLKNLWRIASADLGFDSEHVVTASFTLPRLRYGANEQQIDFFRRLEERIAHIPGAGSSAITDSLPPTGGTRARPFSALQIEGQPPFDQGTGGMIAWRFVTPGYFSTLGIPIIAGRGFTEEDRVAGQPVAVVSQSLARKLFEGENPVGRRIKLDAWTTIVGVARNTKNLGAERSDPEYYLLRRPVADETYNNQGPGGAWRHAIVAVRTPLDPRTMTQWLRSELASMDPTIPVEFSTLAAHVGTLSSRPRFHATLIGLFAAMGVALAAIGLYGVMAFLVAQRTREIGVRMALGATPANVIRLVITRAARWTIGGAAVGLLGSLYTGRLLRAILFESAGTDVWVLAGVVALLLACALAAAWIPARRASRVDPMTALRHE